MSINASHGITCSKSNAGVFASAASLNRAIFCRFLGKPLTRYQFIAVLAKVLTKSSINVKNFKSHSFRVGAATTLALQVETTMSSTRQVDGNLMAIAHIFLIDKNYWVSLISYIHYL